MSSILILQHKLASRHSAGCGTARSSGFTRDGNEKLGYSRSHRSSIYCSAQG
jgi:hypothetical protein